MDRLAVSSHSLSPRSSLLETIYAALEKLKLSMGGITQAFRRSAVKEELESLKHRLAEFDMKFLVRLATIFWTKCLT